MQETFTGSSCPQQSSPHVSLARIDHMQFSKSFSDEEMEFHDWLRLHNTTLLSRGLGVGWADHFLRINSYIWLKNGACIMDQNWSPPENKGELKGN